MSRLTLDGFKITWTHEEFNAYLEDRVSGDVAIDLKLGGKAVPDWPIQVFSDSQGGPLDCTLGPDEQTVIVRLRVGTRFVEGEKLKVYYWRLDR